MITNLIIDASRDPNVWGGNPPKDFSYWRYVANLCAQHRAPMPPSFMEIRGYVLPVINHGKWCLVCPNPHCNNGMLVSWRDPLFWCSHCRMEWNERKPCRALFPREREKIELALSMRPLQFRNWEQGESLADVARTNLEHKEDLYALEFA